MSIQPAIDALNDAFRRDPATISAMLEIEWLCNEALAEHPTVQVGPGTSGKNTVVRFIGLLNGAIEPLTGQRVAMVMEDEQLQGFTAYSHPTA